jgi:hypothetical protein
MAVWLNGFVPFKLHSGSLVQCHRVILNCTYSQQTCANTPKKMMWLVEIIRQETNAEIQDLFFFCIEGTDNSVTQQIRCCCSCGPLPLKNPEGTVDLNLIEI